MVFEKGKIISVKHYSSAAAIKSIIVSQPDEKTLEIRLRKEFAILNFLNDDPVVVLTDTHNKDDNISYLISTTVKSINNRNNLVVLSIERLQLFTNSRKYERLPVSFYIDIYPRDKKGQKSVATVHNISVKGLLIHCKENFEIDDRLRTDLYTEQSVITLDTVVVVRKILKEDRFEYGIQVMYNSIETKRKIVLYMRDIQNSCQEELEDLKYY
jgi:hypothetical protein